MPTPNASLKSSREIVLFDHRGDPIERTRRPAAARAKSVSETGFFGNSSFAEAISGLSMAPGWRAMDPFRTHSWVYSAAMAVAINLAQAPIMVAQETETSLDIRRKSVERGGRVWTGPKAGARRCAFARHLNTRDRLKAGHKLRAVEPIHDHPMTPVFTRPSEILISASMLTQATGLWLCLRGEAFWLHLNDSGQPIEAGEFPTRIECPPPDCFTPFYLRNELSAWWFSVPAGYGLGGSGRRILLDLHQVSQFRFFNPYNPVRGLSPIAAAAAGIELDIMADRHNRSTLARGAKPGGVLVDKSPGGGNFGDVKEREQYTEDFDQNYAGPENAGRTAALAPGMEWVRTSLTPADMEFVEQGKNSREKVFATLRMPKSVLSITDDLNYATALAHDKMFTERTLFPMWLLIEQTLDATLFYPDTDNVFAMYDLTGVESLKAGIGEQILMADKACGPNLHMPPEVAFELVGLLVPEYEGDDVALASPVLAPVPDILSGLVGPLAEPPPEPAPEPGDKPAGPAPANDAGKESKLVLLPSAALSEVQRGRSDRYWAKIIAEVQVPIERTIVPSWRKWVIAERRAQLERFDKKAKALGVSLRDEKPPAVDFEAVLSPIGESQARLGGLFRPAYMNSLELVYDWTGEVDFGGIPVFALDDPALVKFVSDRSKFLVGKAPVSIQNNLRGQYKAWLDAGEPLSELRARIGEVYNIAESSSKTLMIARTETSAFLNGSRDVMFHEQGFKNQAWTTGNDEHVRKSHEAYGASGDHPRGFDFLTIRPGGPLGGHLRFCHDPEAPAGEVVNCRCCMQPKE